MLLESFEEARLLSRLKNHEEEALCQIIDLYSAYVQTIIYRIIGISMTPEDMEEVASDVFFTLWKQSSSVRPGKLKAYLGSVARNVSFKKLRQRNLHFSLDLEEVQELIVQDFPEVTFLKKEKTLQLLKAIELLGKPDKEIFIRYYFENQKVDEIAKELKMNPSTVKSRLSRGRKTLENILKEGGYDYENG